MKFKGKISYLGEKISILPWQMAEQLVVEVNVKNVTEQQQQQQQVKPYYLIWILLNKSNFNQLNPNQINELVLLLLLLLLLLCHRKVPCVMVLAMLWS